MVTTAALFVIGLWWFTNPPGIALANQQHPTAPISEHRLFQLADPATSRSLQEIQNLPEQQWQQVHAVNFGYRGGTGWVRSDIYSSSPQTVILELQSHFIEEVTVWLVANTTIIKEYPTTNHRMLAEPSLNPLMHRYFTFELPLEPEKDYQLFILASNPPGFTLKYTAAYWHPGAFIGHLRNSDWGWAIFVGMVFITVCTAFACFLFHQQRIYFYYAGYVWALALYALLNDGWGMFLSQSLRFFSHPILIGHFLNLGIYFFLLFSREFLVIENPKKWWLRINPWWCWLLISACITLTHYGYAHHQTAFTMSGYWLGMVAVSLPGLLWLSYIWDGLQRNFNPTWLLVGSQLAMLLFYASNVFLVNLNAWTLAYPDMVIFRAALVVDFAIIAAGWIYRQKVIRESEQRLLAVNKRQLQTIGEAERRLQEEEIKALRLENELYAQRDRLARDLHDGIGSQLSHIISRLDLLSLAPAPPQDQLLRLSDFTRETNQNLRETIWILNREQIAFNDFSGRLHSFLRTIWEDRETPTLHWQSNNTCENQVLPHTVALHLFRIAQEATVNAVKHAKAGQVNVEINQLESEIRLTVSDNGKGFHHAVPSSGFGIDNMKKRAEEMRAIFELATGDLGTHIRVTIPLTV